MSVVTKESNPELYNALFPEDEIKEINIPENVLVALGDLTNGALNYYKATETVKVRHNTILDHITNLQEKYERMKENAKILSNGYNDLEKRNEKANSLLDELLERAYIDGEYIMYDYSTSELLEVKQALQGEDKDE